MVTIKGDKVYCKEKLMDIPGKIIGNGLFFLHAVAWSGITIPTF
jgi:hypothetical protein